MVSRGDIFDETESQAKRLAIQKALIRYTLHLYFTDLYNDALRYSDKYSIKGRLESIEYLLLLRNELELTGRQIDLLQEIKKHINNDSLPDALISIKKFWVLTVILYQLCAIDLIPYKNTDELEHFKKLLREDLKFSYTTALNVICGDPFDRVFNKDHSPERVLSILEIESFMDRKLIHLKNFKYEAALFQDKNFDRLISCNISVLTIDRSYYSIGNISALLQLRSLTQVSLSSLDLTDDDAILVSSLPCLTAADLSWNQFNASGLVPLLANTNITYLDLCCNKYEHGRAEIDPAIATHFATANLHTLRVECCGLTGAFVATLASSSTLVELDLAMNESIWDEGIVPIASNTHLKSLDLRNSGLNFFGVLALSINTDLTSLDVSKNRLSQLELDLIASKKHLRSLAYSSKCDPSSLLTNTSLLALKIDGSIANKYKGTFTTCTNLTYLSFYHAKDISATYKDNNSLNFLNLGAYRPCANIADNYKRMQNNRAEFIYDILLILFRKGNHATLWHKLPTEIRKIIVKKFNLEANLRKIGLMPNQAQHLVNYLCDNFEKIMLMVANKKPLVFYQAGLKTYDIRDLENNFLYLSGINQTMPQQVQLSKKYYA